MSDEPLPPVVFASGEYGKAIMKAARQLQLVLETRYGNSMLRDDEIAKAHRAFKAVWEIEATTQAIYNCQSQCDGDGYALRPRGFGESIGVPCLCPAGRWRGQWMVWKGFIKP